MTSYYPFSNKSTTQKIHMSYSRNDQAQSSKNFQFFQQETKMYYTPETGFHFHSSFVLVKFRND